MVVISNLHYHYHYLVLLLLLLLLVLLVLFFFFFWGGGGVFLIISSVRCILTSTFIPDEIFRRSIPLDVPDSFRRS